jgi:hypothetical protein
MPHSLRFWTRLVVPRQSLVAFQFSSSSFRNWVPIYGTSERARRAPTGRHLQAPLELRPHWRRSYAARLVSLLVARCRRCNIRCAQARKREMNSQQLPIFCAGRRRSFNLNTQSIQVRSQLSIIGMTSFNFDIAQWPVPGMRWTSVCKRPLKTVVSA